MSNQKPYSYPSIAALINSYKLTGPTSIARNKDPYNFYVGEKSPVQWELEPEPCLDYNIIYNLAVRFAPLFKVAEGKKFYDAFEAVAEARSNYHRCRLEHQKAHTELQDTSLFHTMMTERTQEVKKQIAQWQEKKGMEFVLKKKRMELETIKWQIKRNDKSATALFLKVQKLAGLKAQVSMHFVDMKVSLIKNYVPQLAVLEKQYWKVAQDRVIRMRMAKIKGPRPRELSTSEKEAITRYHQATHGEIVNRAKPSPQLARAIEQARIAVSQPPTGPPKSTS